MTFAIVWLVGYLLWTDLYFRLIDPAVRELVGRALGVPIVWTYDARHYLQQGRYRSWRWGVAGAPADQVLFVELIVHALCAGIVMILAGMWPVALLYVAMLRHWAAPLAIYACTLLAIPIFAIYWSGRYRPPHARNQSS